MNLFVLKEAVHSVALSHDEGHDCDVCKAAAGDRDAWTRVVVAWATVAANHRGMS